MNKQGQIGVGIITLVGIGIVLLVLAPILLDVVTTTVGEFSDALNNTDTNAAATVNSIETSFVNLWDLVLVLFFGLNIILLLLSAFFIDTHPAFVIIYIMMAFFVLVFAPNVLDAVDEIWSQTQYAEETGLYLTGMNFILAYFETIVLGIIVMSGIVMYAKFKYFSQP